MAKNSDLTPEKRLSGIEIIEKDQKNNWDNCKKELPTAGDQIVIRCSYLKAQLNKIIKKKEEVNDGDSNAN